MTNEANARADIARIVRLYHANDVEGLIEELTNPAINKGVPVRAEAARRLGKLKDPHAVPALRSRLEGDPDEYVRIRAVLSLGRMNGERALTALIAALHQDPSVAVRTHAATTLGHLREHRAADALTHALLAQDRYLRRAAAKSLVEIGAPDAERLIRAARKRETGYVRLSMSKALWRAKRKRRE